MKTIKAWGILDHNGKLILHSIGLVESVVDSDRWHNWGDDAKTIPITISYEVKK